MNWKIDIDEDRGNEGLPWALVRTVDMILRAGEAVDEFSSKYSNRVRFSSSKIIMPTERREIRRVTGGRPGAC